MTHQTTVRSLHRRLILALGCLAAAIGLLGAVAAFGHGAPAREPFQRGLGPRGLDGTSVSRRGARTRGPGAPGTA